jgi:hypothetical protein
MFCASDEFRGTHWWRRLKRHGSVGVRSEECASCQTSIARQCDEAGSYLKPSRPGLEDLAELLKDIGMALSMPDNVRYVK